MTTTTMMGDDEDAIDDDFDDDDDDDHVQDHGAQHSASCPAVLTSLHLTGSWGRLAGARIDVALCDPAAHIIFNLAVLLLRRGHLPNQNQAQLELST